MKRIIQTKLHDPPRQKGNCFATVVACFLDLKIEDVPAFEEMMPFDNSNPQDNKTWVNTAFQFMLDNGYEWGSLDGHTEGFYTVVGKSPRGVNHICIYKDGELWHDPHPDQTGLLTEDHFEYIQKL